MAGYRYGGTEFDAHLPLAEPKTRKKYERGPAKCGTTGGYDAHRRAKEPTCEPCLAAIRAYRKEWRARVKAAGKKVGRKPMAPTVEPVTREAECGTYAGYAQHRRRGEAACRPCKDACNARQREKYQPSSLTVFTGERCGTMSGYKSHRWYGVPPCAACLAANATYYRERYAARKAAA